MKILKLLLPICVFYLGTYSYAQNRKITKTGAITFEASVPSFEEVKATNKTVSCILNTKTGEIASLALMKGFRFKIALMEEHFNENYIESDKYPKAIFKGKIKDFNLNALNNIKTKYEINGTLELHGVTKNLSTIVYLSKNADDIVLTSDFTVIPDDFNINIPKIVRKKVAETVQVKIAYVLQ